MLTSRIDPARTINEILARHPATIAVINAFGIDTCCGGGVTLETAARDNGLDLATVTAALEAAITREVA